jgi:hypothetical protein
MLDPTLQKTMEEVKALQKLQRAAQLKEQGFDLNPNVLRSRNPFCKTYENRTLQTFLDRFEPQLANELKSGL